MVKAPSDKIAPSDQSESTNNFSTPNSKIAISQLQGKITIDFHQVEESAVKLNEVGVSFTVTKPTP